MNYVFISPHFPSNFKNFAVGLKRAGVNVFGVASEPFELLDADLRESLTEYYRVNDMENYDEMLRAVAYLTYKHGKMDRIESHNEYWLAQDARLRTDFNVFGFKNEDMAFVKLKSAMKEKFREVGIRVARGRVIGDYHDALGLCHEYGFPVCIKPDSGVGAADTHKIRSEEELGHFFHVKNPYESYILEEFIDGKIVTYDGLTDAAGNILFDATLVYEKAVLEIVEKNADMFYYVDRNMPDDLREIGTKLVEAFNVRERFFHFEFFRLPDGSLVALEANLRPPGGHTMDMWNWANDVDLYAAYGNLVATGNFTAQMNTPYY
ncbi:MAG: ATP-grasp domain-containing protein, partial [Trichococcus sp.]|uniref:ATP-grasp domain-containing protein n=1 Tax=Trichococcus sp. TaxID=1985464 RepID=UPI003C6158EF